MIFSRTAGLRDFVAIRSKIRKIRDIVMVDGIESIDMGGEGGDAC